MFDVQQSDVLLPGEAPVADEDPVLYDVGEGHPAEYLGEVVGEEPERQFNRNTCGLRSYLKCLKNFISTTITRSMSGMGQLVWDDIKFLDIQWDTLISISPDTWDS